ncbi:hypothetical protein [Mycolicibacter kumamotonensis]|uniref:Uncharacterized protein n=1 Tax=Mycolicibacter kumamotonensis TaxID=354243 RepID=A0A7K3LEJ5_9MYCO|nr:hypothetical protein [Mycolicibacter kumamotonensis]NDJ90742.1 hypothetical protein [Mycolicibacter kumamotonensis]
MTTDDIWPAVQALATTWLASPVVGNFLARHPARNDSEDVVTEALRNLQAGGSVLTETPLWTSTWEQLAQQMPLVQLTDEVRAYLRQIAPLGHALESTVGWVRSRLPLYPGIPVPQFSPRGYRRSPEFSLRMPWIQPLLQAGLPEEASPPSVADLLGLDEHEVLSNAQNLVSALCDSAEWKRYADLAAALTDHDRDALADARRRVGVLLNPRLVDQYEDARNERRNAYRREHVAEVVVGLDGRPRELADAFDVIDDLIDHALVNVHGQLVVRGGVPMIEPIDLDIDGPQVRFDYDGDDSFGVGESVLLDDPLAAGAYLIDSMNFRFGQFEGTRMSFTARSLPGTENAFQAS